MESPFPNPLISALSVPIPSPSRWPFPSSNLSYSPASCLEPAPQGEVSHSSHWRAEEKKRGQVLGMWEKAPQESHVENAAVDQGGKGRVGPTGSLGPTYMHCRM